MNRLLRFGFGGSTVLVEIQCRVTRQRVVRIQRY